MFMLPTSVSFKEVLDYVLGARKNGNKRPNGKYPRHGANQHLGRLPGQ